ncbi:benzoate 1,2-dioxygenase electron transfer component BenC [Burkholderia anthina]|uniref:benzoate 1,2-dioxygenase electron transfer component BenC n=1 Tax=Burkholderia anthina TaxID=179879 RepID=UPI00158D081C
MLHSIALRFEDDVTYFITSSEHETIADAAFRQGISIPLDCRDGACGTCKGFCERGEYDGGAYIDDALSADEAREGFVLPCQMRARTDCVVRIPASSSACKVKKSTMAGQLSHIERASASTLQFTLSVEPSSKVDFLPGQYAQVRIPGTTESRAYSYSSKPGSGEASFLVRDVPNGKMSGYLRDRAMLDETFTFDGPYGAFYLREPVRPILMLAGGTGLAPFLSMLRYLAELQRNGLPKIRLVYGVNCDDDLVGLKELDELAIRLPSFGYLTTVVHESSAQPRRGYVTQHITKDDLNSGDVDIYVCGPPPMVEAVRGWLTAEKVTPANFYFEKFAPTVGD